MSKKQELIEFIKQVPQIPFARRAVIILVLFYALVGVWFMFFQDGVVQRAAEKNAEIEMLRGAHGKK